MTGSVPALPPPFHWIRRDQVGSTNDEARRLAATGRAVDLMVVSAVTQTAGRGRRGRTWVSPAGNLHGSVLIRVAEPPVQAAQLGFAAAAALAAAIEDLAPAIEARCKWPNDVLCRIEAGHAKVAGMLLEMAGDGWLVLGLGVDVACAPPPDMVGYPAMSLAGLGWRGDADGVLAALCRRFGPMIETWRRDGFAPVRAAWLERALGLGGPVEVRLENETLRGRFAALDDDGALLLDQGAAGMRRVLAGDVFFPPRR